MPKFMCWEEDKSETAWPFTARDAEHAAELFAERQMFTSATNVCVSDEMARVFMVEIKVRFEYHWTDAKLLSGADLFSDDPMPTKEAEALRDARSAV